MNSSRIRIVFLIDIMDSRSFLGGAELHTFDIMNNLNKKQFEVCCVSDSIGYLDYVRSQSNNIIQTFFLKKKLKVFGDFLYFFPIYKILSIIKPDIVHTQKLKSCIWGRLAGWLYGARVVSTLHGAPSFWKFGFIKNTLNRLANALTANFFCDVNVALSYKEKETLIDKDMVNSRTIKVVYSGIFNTKKFATQDEEPRHYIQLISVARLSWEKGHKFLIQAFHRVHSSFPATKLLIVGGGAEKDNLVKEVIKLRLENDVCFIGEITRDQIPYFLNKSDIFILPSVWEGMPYAILEAMFAGLPVVATKVGGIPELIIEDKGGLLVRYANVQDLQNAIIRLLEDVDLWRQMGLFNRERAFHYFRGEKMIEEYKKIYLDLVDRKSKRQIQ